MRRIKLEYIQINEWEELNWSSYNIFDKSHLLRKIKIERKTKSNKIIFILGWSKRTSFNF